MENYKNFFSQFIDDARTIWIASKKQEDDQAKTSAILNAFNTLLDYYENNLDKIRDRHCLDLVHQVLVKLRFTLKFTDLLSKIDQSDSLPENSGVQATNALTPHARIEEHVRILQVMYQLQRLLQAIVADDYSTAFSDFFPKSDSLLSFITSHSDKVQAGVTDYHELGFYDAPTWNLFSGVNNHHNWQTRLETVRTTLRNHLFTILAKPNLREELNNLLNPIPNIQQDFTKTSQMIQDYLNAPDEYGQHQVAKAYISSDKQQFEQKITSVEAILKRPEFLDLD